MLNQEIQEMESKLESRLAQEEDYAPRDFQFRMSAAGNCPRQMDYDLQDTTPLEERPTLDLQHILRMARGTWMHSMWQEFWEKTLPGEFVEAEREIGIPMSTGQVIVGHPDGKFKSKNWLYELKTVNDSTFQMIQNQDHPIPSHYEQGNFYAGPMGCDNILVHYFNAGSCESWFGLAPFDQTMWDYTLAKFEGRAANKETGTIEPRPYVDPTASPCWFCHRKETCWEGYEDEFKSMTQVALDDPKLLSVVEAANANRTMRLSADKIEKASKAKVADFLLKAGINEADVCNQFSVKIKLGKNGNPIVNIKERP